MLIDEYVVVYILVLIIMVFGVENSGICEDVLKLLD